MLFEAMNLYRSLDLKYNPMDSSHFENISNERQIVQQLVLIWMSLVSRGLTGVIIALWRRLRYAKMDKLLWGRLIYYDVTNVTEEQ